MYTTPTTGPHVHLVCRLNTKERPTPHEWTNTRIDVLVVLEGPSDGVTAPTFRDIAETVQDGLHGLGHPSRIVYCANIAFDGCVAEGRKVIVLAAHNLAIFSTVGGESAVLKWKLLPPDAGKVCVFMHMCRTNIYISALKTVFLFCSRDQPAYETGALENEIDRILPAHTC